MDEEILDIIDKMESAGESTESIAEVVQEYESRKKPQDPKKAQADVSGESGLASADTTSLSDSVSPEIRLQDQAIREIREDYMNKGVMNYNITPEEVNRRVGLIQDRNENERIKFDRSLISPEQKDYQGMGAYVDNLNKSFVEKNIVSKNKDIQDTIRQVEQTGNIQDAEELKSAFIERELDKQRPISEIQKNFLQNVKEDSLGRIEVNPDFVSNKYNNLANRKNYKYKDGIGIKQGMKSTRSGELVPVDSESISQIYGEDLESYGIDKEDLNSFIETGNDRVKKLWRAGYFTDDTTDLLQSESNEGLLRETAKHATLSSYLSDRLTHLKGKHLGLVKRGDYNQAREVEQEIVKMGRGYEKYVSEKLPNYKRAVEEKLEKEYKEYAKKANIGDVKKRPISDLQREFGEATFGQFFKGIETASSDATSYLLDLVGADDSAEYQRMIKDANNEFDRNSLDYGVVSGKKVSHNGKNYLTTDNGRIIDLDVGKDVTSIAEKLKLDTQSILEKGKQSTEELTTYSTKGLIGRGAEVLGNLAFQIASTKNASGVLGLTSRGANLATSMIVQSGMITSATFEETLSELRKANIDDDKAIGEALELSTKMGIVGLVGGAFSPNTAALGVTSKGVDKTLIKDLAKSYVKEGKKGFKNTLNNYLSKKAAPVSKDMLEEWGQELFESTSQKYLNSKVNENIGKDVLDTKMSKAELIEMSILSTSSAGLMASIGKSSADFRDKLSMLEYLSKDVQQSTDFIKSFKEEGALSEANADKLIKDINNYAKYSNKIPEDVPVERVEPLLEALDKRNELELRKKNQDKAFHKEINEEIEKVDAEIANIRKPQEIKDLEKKKESEAEVKPNQDVKEQPKTDEGTREEPKISTSEKEGVPLRRPVGKTVKESLNREIRINSIGDSEFVRPIKGDLYLDNQTVVLDTRDGKEYELGNIDEVGDLDINDFEGFQLTFEKPNVTVNNKGNVEYRGNEFKVPSSVDKVTKIAGDGEVALIKLKPLSGGKQISLRGQDAIDAYYQLKLNELETDLQKQKVDKIIIKEIQDESRKQQSKRRTNNRTTKKTTPRKTTRDTKKTQEKPKVEKSVSVKIQTKEEPSKEVSSSLKSITNTTTPPKNISVESWNSIRDIVSESFDTYKDIELSIKKGLESLRSTKEYQNSSEKDKKILEGNYLDHFIKILPREPNKKWYQKLNDFRKRIVQRKRQKFVDVFTNMNEATKTLKGFKDFYQEQGLFESKAATKVNKMLDKVKKHVEGITRSKFTTKQVSDYMYAIDAINRNKYINENVNEENPYGSGKTDKQANAILDQYTKEEIKKLEKIAKPFYDLIEETRKYLVESGLMSKDAVDKLREVNPTYVPLTGFSDEQIDIGDSILSGKKLNIKGREIKKMKGRKTEANDVISNIIFQYSDVHLKGSKNTLLNTLVDIHYKNPEDSVPFTIYTQETLPKKVDLNKEGRAIETKESAQLDNYIGVKRNGKQLYLKFDNPVLAKNLNRATDATVDAITKRLGVFNRYLSMTITAYSPEFLLPNFARDFETAFINLKSQADINEDLKGKDLSTKVSKRTLKSIRQLYRYERGKKLPDDVRNYIDEFLNSGARTGWTHKMSLYETEAKVKSVEKLFKPADTKKEQYLRNVKKGFHNLADYMDDVSGSLENGVRLATFIEARKAGLTERQAGSLAKELTVNFNRKGEYGSLMNTGYLFFNAAVQGNANFVKNMFTMKEYTDSKGVKRKTLSRGQKFGLFAMLTSHLITMYNMAVSEEDEESGLDNYSKISDYEKERNLIIMFPDGKRYFKIPVGYGLNTILGLGMITAEVGYGKLTDNPNKRTMEDGLSFLLGQYIGAFVPVQLPEGSKARKLAYGLAPTIIKPIAEILENRDYMDNPVAQENFPMSNEKVASAYLGSKNTAQIYKSMAILANSLSGGNQFEEGSLGFHPDKLEHIVKFYGGGVMRTLSDAYYVGESLVLKGLGAEKEVETRKIPIVRSIYGEGGYFPEKKIYYNLKNNVINRLNYLNSEKGRKLNDKDKALLNQLSTSFDITDSILKNIRKKEREVRTRPVSTDNVSELEKLEVKKNQTIARFIKYSYNPIKKKLSKNYE